MSFSQARSVIQVNIANDSLLQSYYLPFVVGGGLFIPSDQFVILGQEIFVMITLAHIAKRFALRTQVVWITPKSNGDKPKGFAVQLAGEHGTELKLLIEEKLSSVYSLDSTTYNI